TGVVAAPPNSRRLLGHYDARSISRRWPSGKSRLSLRACAAWFPAPREGMVDAARFGRWPRRRAMRVTSKVKEILGWYEGEYPGVKANLVRLLMNGKLAGTGKLVILPVDQGYEHGPARSFAPNPAAYDPHYLFDLALDAGLSAYAAPLGPLEKGCESFAG